MSNARDLQENKVPGGQLDVIGMHARRVNTRCSRALSRPVSSLGGLLARHHQFLNH
jgi:hypothetical protein